MSWQALIGISVITFSLSTLLQRTILKRANISPIVFSILFQLLVGIIILIFGLISGAEMDVKLNLNLIVPNLILSSVLYAIANVLKSESLAKTEASKFTIIFSSRVIFTIATAAIFLNESLNIHQVIGTFLILSSIILVTIKGRKLKFEKVDLLALLASVIFGIGIVNDRYILKLANIYPYMVFDFVAPSLLLLVFYFKELPQIKKFLEFKVSLQLITLCVIYAISSATFLAALKYGTNVSQISVVNLTSVIITVFLALILLRETDNWVKKSVGALLCFIGLILVS